MGDRVAKVNGKIFAFLGSTETPSARRITVKLDESHAHALAIEGAGGPATGSAAPAG